MKTIVALFSINNCGLYLHSSTSTHHIPAYFGDRFLQRTVIIDVTNISFIKDIVTNGNYFYSFTTDNGIFYELDLSTLTITRTVDTGGTPLQGVFIRN